MGATSDYLNLPCRNIDDVPGAREALGWPEDLRQREADAAGDEPIVPRDLADIASSADLIAIKIKYAGISLSDAYEFGEDIAAPRCQRAVAKLRQAAEELGRLIAEIGGLP